MDRVGKSSLAIFALVLSTLFFLPGLPLLGAILGVVALRRIARSNGALGGRQIAIFAIVIGLSTGLLFQGVLFAISVPRYLAFVRQVRTSEAQTILYSMRA